MPRNYTNLTQAADLPSAGGGINTDTTQVVNLEATFRRIRARAEYLSVRDGGQFAGTRYTVRAANHHGFLNHFQGMRRLRDGKHLLISGSDWEKDTRNSHIFVIKMASRPAEGFWGSNIMFNKKPPEEDTVVKTIGIDKQLWHPGGMDVLGDLVVVPIEQGTNETVRRVAKAGPADPNHSKIVFFDMTDPEKPKFFKDCSIDRPDVKAGAAALTKLQTDYFLVAVWSDSDALPPRLEFYLSDEPNFPSAFTREPTTWFPEQVATLEGQTPTFGNFQALNFVRQKEENNEEQLYLVGFRKADEFNLAELYTIDIGEDTNPPEPGKGIELPNITKVATRAFQDNKYCDMAGASGLYVEPNTGKPIIYSSHQFRRKEGILRLSEFSVPKSKGEGEVTDLKDSWVELFEESHFKGRFLRLFDLSANHATIRDYSKVRAQGETFNDKVSSVRYQIPEGVTYQLYDDKNFKKDILPLPGRGTIVEMGELENRGLAGEVSSSRLI